MEYLTDLEGVVLGAVLRKDEITSGRENLCPDKELLQICGKRLDPGESFPPHEHLPLERSTVGTREAWIVIEGEVSVTVFDEAGTPVHVLPLGRGDCFVLFRGAHSMKVTQPTVMYEVKNGPYRGQAADKRWL